MSAETDPPGQAPAPRSLVPLPPFLRGSIEIRGPVPVAVQPGFLLLMAYLGYVLGGSTSRPDFAARAAVAAAVAALSVFWHECGHAAAVLAFGGRPKITLVATGGATTSGKTEPEFWRDLLVAASGPLAGYLLSVAAGSALRHGVAAYGSLFFFALAVARAANWIWTLLNLLPAMPLDGGNVVRILFQRVFGGAGLRRTYLLSSGVCGGLVGYALLRTDWLLAYFAFFMTVSNFKTYRNLTDSFSDAEMAPEVQRVIKRVGALERERKVREAYELLLPLEGVLGSRNTRALAVHACELGEYRKAAELCEPLHAKRKRDYSAAFVAARAYAGLGDAASAARWLKQAISDGMPNADKAVSECRQFDAIRADPIIDAVLHPLGKIGGSDLPADDRL